MGSRSAITAVLCGMLLLLLSCSSTQELSLLSQQSYNLGNAYLRLGEYEQAEAAYRFAVEEAPEYYRASYNLAYAYSAQGKYAQAVTLLDGLIDSYPDEKELYELRAYVRYQQADLQRALGEFEAMIDRWDDQQLRLSAAKIALELGLYERADVHLRYLYDEDLLSAELLYLIGETERLSGVSDGMQWYATAVLEDPGYLPALQYLLDLAGSAGEKTDQEILRILSQASEAAPEDPSVAYQYAQMLLAEGDDLGVQIMNRAIELGFADTDQLLALYDLLEGDLARSYLEMLEAADLIRIVPVPDQP